MPGGISFLPDFRPGFYLKKNDLSATVLNQRLSAIQNNSHDKIFQQPQQNFIFPDNCRATQRMFERHDPAYLFLLLVRTTL